MDDAWQNRIIDAILERVQAFETSGSAGAVVCSSAQTSAPGVAAAREKADGCGIDMEDALLATTSLLSSSTEDLMRLPHVVSDLARAVAGTQTFEGAATGTLSLVHSSTEESGSSDFNVTDLLGAAFSQPSQRSSFDEWPTGAAVAEPSRCSLPAWHNRHNSQPATADTGMPAGATTAAVQSSNACAPRTMVAKASAFGAAQAIIAGQQLGGITGGHCMSDQGKPVSGLPPAPTMSCTSHRLSSLSSASSWTTDSSSSSLLRSPSEAAAAAAAAAAAVVGTSADAQLAVLKATNGMPPGPGLWATATAVGNAAGTGVANIGLQQ